MLLADTLQLSGVNMADVVFARDPANNLDLILTFSDGGSIRIDDQLQAQGWDRVENFAFADGALTVAQVNARMLDQAGTAGNDTISGFATTDVLRGRGGDDYLSGGGGNDTYHYAQGDGQDVVYDGAISAFDAFIFEGVDLSTVTFARAGNDADDLIITFADGGSVRIDEQFDSLGWFRIEAFDFGSGVTLTHADILGMV